MKIDREKVTFQAHSTNLVRQLMEDEGCVLKPYRCTAGAWTFGWGHNFSANGISQRIADLILEEDLETATQDAIYLFPNLWGFYTARRNALINLSFNMGRTRLAKFVKAREAVAKGNWEQACKEFRRSVWYANPVGHRRKKRITEEIRTGIATRYG